MMIIRNAQKFFLTANVSAANDVRRTCDQIMASINSRLNIQLDGNDEIPVLSAAKSESAEHYVLSPEGGCKNACARSLLQILQPQGPSAKHSAFNVVFQQLNPFFETSNVEGFWVCWRLKNLLSKSSVLCLTQPWSAIRTIFAGFYAPSNAKPFAADAALHSVATHLEI